MNATKLGQFHADTKGKIKATSENGENCFVTAMDEFPRYMFAKPIRNKTTDSKVVQEFVKWFERQSGRPVCSLHTDGGPEFFNVQRNLKREGMDIHCTTAFTPQSNSLAERRNGILLSHTKAILRQSNLRIRFRNYAILHAVACENILPQTTTGKFPYHVIHGYGSTELQHIRPFGFRLMYHPLTNRLSTFQHRIYEGVCLGHDGGSAYVVLSADGIIKPQHTRDLEN